MANTSNRKQAIVIGGGITGLTACYRLVAESRKRGISLDVKLFEARDRVGGVIHTSKQDGFILEHGPDSFITTEPWAKALCEELGIANQLIGANPEQRRSFIVRKGKLCSVPEGFYMLAPASLLPFVMTPIFSWPGKLRMALDLLIPRRRSDQDESVDNFVKRRLGKEAFTRMAQPMISGIYTADAENLSLKATLPQFIKMEQEYGSIIKGLIARKKQSKGGSSGTSGPRYSLFLSFKYGMQTLTDTLIERLPANCIQLASKVDRVEYFTDQRRWDIYLDNQQKLQADLVCITLPAPCVAMLVKTAAPEMSDLLTSIPYASSAAVNLAFRREDVAHPLNGMGFVVPTIERRSILGCSFSSVKFEGRAPGDQVLLRAFVGGALHPNRLLQSDPELLEAVLKDLRELLGLKGEPTLAIVSRHAGAMAQYHLGHLDKVAKIENHARQLSGFALAGGAYRGRGVPNCIHSAEEAAHSLLDFLMN